MSSNVCGKNLEGFSLGRRWVRSDFMILAYYKIGRVMSQKTNYQKRTRDDKFHCYINSCFFPLSDSFFLTDIFS